MATVKFTAYVEDHLEQPLQPGETRWFSYSDPDFGVHATSVTAVPVIGESSNTHVMQVDDINVTLIKGHDGAVPTKDYYLGFNVINNGQEPILTWHVLIGLIGA